RAFACQSDRDRMPDPPPRASDNGALIFKSHAQAAMLRAPLKLSTRHHDRDRAHRPSGVRLCRRLVRKVLRLKFVMRQQVSRYFLRKDFELSAPNQKCTYDPIQQNTAV